MKKPNLVSEIMTHKVITVFEEDNLTGVEEGMAHFKFRHLPVVDGKKLVGLVTQRDLLRIAASALEAGAEQALAQAVAAAAQAVAPMAAARCYREALAQLASLREPVDAFFEAVLVNADDVAVRANRLALLNQLRGLFLGVADISLLG